MATKKNVEESNAIVVKPAELSDLLNKAFKKGLPVLITGAPGVGKSDIVSQACEMAGFKLILSHPVVSDPTDFKGLPFPNEDGKTATFLPFGDLADLVEATEPTVFFLDDLGQAPPAVQAACMQLLLARRVNGHKVSDLVCFVAATNRRQDRAGVQGILEPVKSRFASIVELRVDMEDWVKWALKKDLPVELISFIRFKPGLLCDFQASHDMRNSPCPRTWHNLSKLLDAGIDLYAALAGCVGEGAAGEFLAFRRIFKSLPNPDVVLMNPDTAPVPDPTKEPATLYALAGALAHKASEANIERLVTYLFRIPPEFSVMCMRDAAQKNSKIVNTKAFVRWASQNADVLI